MNIYTIYKATNLINNKCYIGFDSRFPRRIYFHKYNYPNTDFKFYRAIRKYGWDNFEWEIIYQSNDKDYTKNIMENYFIEEYDSYLNGYNSTFGGEGTFGYIRSQEEKDFISGMISKRNKGRLWFNNGIENKFCHSPPDESWKKGRINQKPTTKGNKWYNNGKEQLLTKTPPEGWFEGMLPKPPVTEETRKKMSKNNKGRIPWNAGKSAAQLYKKIMTPEGEFESHTIAAKHYNVPIARISTWKKTNPNEFYSMK
jgi:group I intron endonuclease